MKHDPIAYTYEAGTHCPACAEKRFGLDEFGFIAGVDSEGNEVGAIAPWDEWHDPEGGEQFLECGTCRDIIEAFHPPDLLTGASHYPNKDCTGVVTGYKCPECQRPLCHCEHDYGHDCE